MSIFDATSRGRLVLGAVKAGAVGALMMLVAVSGVQASGDDAAPTAPARAGVVEVAPQQPGLREAMARHQCTETGFGAAATPRSAIVSQGGALQHVSFDQAWRVFTGETPGSLVAVCLSER